MTVVVVGDNTGNDFAGSEDTYIRNNLADTNFSTATTLIAEFLGAASRQHHFLLKFSGLSNITPPVTLTSCTVSLFLTSGSGTTVTTRLQRLLRNWVLAEATWNIYSTGNSWETAGAGGANDISSTVSEDLASDTTSEYKSFSDTQLTSDYKDFINGDLSNYGHRFALQAPSDGDRRTFASEQGTDGQRPYVTIDYEAVSAVFTKIVGGFGPGMALAGMGGLAG